MTSTWTQKHNWAEPFLVSYSFKTEVITSRSGKEQRRALRSQPRRSFEFAFLAKGRSARELTYGLGRFLRQRVLVPEVTEYVLLTAKATVGAGSVSLTAAPGWAVAGASVMLTDGGRVETLVIDSVTGSVLSFTTALAHTWHPGTKAVALRSGLIDPEIELTLHTDDVLSGNVSFSIEPGSEKFDTTDPGGLFFRGREVFPFRFNWADPLSLGQSYQRNVVDYEDGARRVYNRVADQVLTFSGTTVCDGPELAKAVVDFFVRMKGRRGEFLMPSPYSDLELQSEVTSGLNTLDLVGDFERVFDTDSTTRMLQVISPQGWTYYREITSAVRDGSTTTVEIDQGFPLDITPGQFRIAALYVSRLSSDEINVEWLTDRVSTIRLNVTALPYSEPEAPLADFDEGALWLIDYYGSVFVRDVFADPLQRIINEIVPRFALLLDDSAEYMIETYGRNRTRVYLAEPLERIMNTLIPNFAEI